MSWLRVLDASQSAADEAERLIRARRTYSWGTAKEFMSDAHGRKCAKRFLARSGESGLYTFLKDTRDFRRILDAGDASDELLERLATRVYATYFSGGIQQSVPWLSAHATSVTQALHAKDYASMLEGAHSEAERRFEALLPSLKKSPEYADLLEKVCDPEEQAEAFGSDTEIFLHVMLAPRTVHALVQPETSIGRDPSNDVQVDDPTVSRFHCKISKRSGGTYVIIDAGSSSRTKVNGARIVRCGLRSSDVVRIGKVECMISARKSVQQQ